MPWTKRHPYLPFHPKSPASKGYGWRALPKSPSPFVGLVLLVLLAAVGALACSTGIEPRDAALPDGFRDTPIPNVDLGGYLYLSRTAPLISPADKLVPGFRPSSDSPRQVEMENLKVWVSSSPSVYGIGYEFTDAETALWLITELEETDTKLSYSIDGNTVYVFYGGGDWIEALRASINEDRYVKIQDVYPDAWVLYNLLPEVPVGEPVAAGFGRLGTDLLGYLERDVASEAGFLRRFASSARIENVVFGLYSTEEETNLDQLHKDSLLENSHQGVVLATRSSYPNFLVSFIFGGASSRAGLRKVSVSGSEGSAKAYHTSPVDEFHVIVSNRGNLFTIALSPAREMAERLILKALGK